MFIVPVSLFNTVPLFVNVLSTVNCPLFSKLAPSTTFTVDIDAIPLFVSLLFSDIFKVPCKIEPEVVTSPAIAVVPVPVIELAPKFPPPSVRLPVLITLPFKLLASEVAEPVFVKVPVSLASLLNVELFTTSAVTPAMFVNVAPSLMFTVPCTKALSTVATPAMFNIPFPVKLPRLFVPPTVNSPLLRI